MGTTWPQHRYDISITHQQQFLQQQQQQHDNFYNNNNNNNNSKNSSSTRTTALANGSNFKATRFCATHKHKANQRQQQQHYASQRLRQQQHHQQKEQQQQEHEQQQQQQQQQQQMMYKPANVGSTGPQMRSLPAAVTPSTGCDILWPAVLQPAMMLLFLSTSSSSSSSNAWLLLPLLWSLLQGLRSRIASPRALAYHAYLPKPVRTLRNNNESSFNTAPAKGTPMLQLRRLRQSASSWICKSLHALFFHWLSSSICCLYSMQVSGNTES
ncbi:hypothetical protein M5D96_003109, partial [Drosophila gunungcola]